MKRKDIPVMSATTDELFKYPLTKRTMRDFRIIEYFLFILKILFVLNSAMAVVSFITLVVSFNHNRLFSTLNVVVVAIIYIIIALLIVYLNEKKINKNNKLLEKKNIKIKDPFNEIIYSRENKCYLKRPYIPKIYEVKHYTRVRSRVYEEVK